MGADEVNAFLGSLALDRRLSAVPRIRPSALFCFSIVMC